MRLSVRACAGVLSVMAIFAPPAVGQPTTADGIRAVLGGEYHVAARMLQPLADDETTPDPVAQFFLGFLYQNGLGVTPDVGRACRLFLRASRGNHAFSEQSAAIAALMRDQLGGGVCAADERWQGGPPQSFVLGPLHRVVFADTSVRITYGEREEQTTLLLPTNVVFLPIQYTPLQSTRPKESRRHFIQWFYWKPGPAPGPSSWTLGWTLSEVVGARWIVIASENNLLIAQGSRPPTSATVTTLVRLGINANGEAEFSIPGGATPRSEIIGWRGSR